MKNILFGISTFILVCTTIACHDYLDEKADSLLSLPETLEDNQALLDRYFLLGLHSNSGEISADDIYLSEVDFNAMPREAEKRLHTWQPDHVSTASGNDWANAYSKINIFNNVLYNVDFFKIPNAGNVVGQALTLRAGLYLDAAQIWCLAYDPTTAKTDYGLPLRLDPDMNKPSVRSSLQQTYDQIIEDLQRAASLLPDQQIAVSRPSKVTALGYLSRTYLFMGDYKNALQNGLEALAIHGKLMNYNTLNPATSYPIPNANIEVLLPTNNASSPFITVTKAKIPAAIYGSFATNDLRKSLFFRTNNDGEILFRGNYGGSSSRINCLANDEIYLTVAECYARLNKTTEAMATLNKLLITRWKTGTFVPLTAQNAADALQQIKTERRKELLFRGLRWADVKRYNKEGAGIILTRSINGQTYTLPANDLRSAIAIPEDIILMTGMPQNPR